MEVIESSERDDCIYANFEFPLSSLLFSLSRLLFLSFEMDTFVHGLGRILLDALFSLVFMMVFFSYICIYKTSVCERITQAMFSLDTSSERRKIIEKKKKTSKRKNKATIFFVEMLYTSMLFDEK